MSLCIEMLLAGRLAENSDEARQRLQAVLDNGRAAEVFGRMVAAQGGPTDFVEQMGAYLPAAVLSKPVFAAHSGVITAMGTRHGGGRARRLASSGGGRYRPQRRVRRRGEPGR